ncbi:DNA-directed RNA polymerase II subunit RPB7 [Cryptococcus neoformans var. grubii Br795]|nr:DNA-directed RNA polymerase II subunit RPB7 [Cryptococcus neoformans var. grubii Bt120]OXG50964.1 DNA-directed RNA polymerase II subunit RPB7 [Cryptococcus neoformans var. grubii Th84]OXG82697.1 DNA-directed RNA polymerase II subunit RPB7 [Cryptococcus neoformans var. grubii MW-RSA36]OXG83574.1 DNA-directed RNA polymerase II subunit RPB7 [Cryptococcus neoformans var. grubii Br795]OXH12403.1 DNA-directed RNA polymerase II subunit RPB7 [Cryptococcus neoformans var. grubii]OXL08776.1 DNA-direc
MLLAPSIHDLFSLLFPFFFPSFHPSTAPSLFSSHPCRDRHPTVIRPSARTLPTSVHGRYRIIHIFPSSFLSGQKGRKKKTANNLSGCSSWLVPPLRESLAIRADTFTAFSCIRTCPTVFFLFLCPKILVAQRELTHTILLHPSYFGAQLEDYLRQKLYEDVEGTCSGKHGYIISVITITDIGEGKIIPSTGQAKFKTRYTAIVMKPFKGEVVDAKVVNVNKMGFFAMVGPLQVFVSCHLTHSDMKFDPSVSPPCYRSNDEIIQKDTKVRIQIVGCRVEANDMFAIGTIKKDYLGQIRDE